jgi:hypothetical protein
MKTHQLGNTDFFITRISPSLNASNPAVTGAIVGARNAKQVESEYSGRSFEVSRRERENKLGNVDRLLRRTGLYLERGNERQPLCDRTKSHRRAMAAKRKSHDLGI